MPTTIKPKSDREAVTLIVEGLSQQGLMPEKVYNGDEYVEVSTVEEAIEEIMAVDGATLWVDLGKGHAPRYSFLFFVLGNEPYEVLADYGVTMSQFVDPICDPWWKEE